MCSQLRINRAGSTYANPDQTTTNVWRQKGPCSDPWVSIALEAVYGRAESGRCNVKLYNGGNWRDYNELVQAVAKVKNYPTIDLSQIRVTKVDEDTISLVSKNGVNLGSFDNGRLTVSLPPNLVAAGGGNLVAAGGGNLVAAGGGNLVAAGGGNLVAAGGGNLAGAVKDVLEKSNPPVALQAGKYGLQSARNFSDLKELSKKK